MLPIASSQSMEHRPKLSIVICTYNRAHFLGDTLKSLADQGFPASDYELLLVDNASTDATPTLAQDFASTHADVPFRYVLETRQGLSNARNRGIAEAQGDVVVFLDDDVRLEKSYLNIIQGFYTKHPEVMATGNTIIPEYLFACPSWMSVYLAPLVGYHRWSQATRPYHGRKFPVGASMAFRKTVFAEVGDFNPALGRTGKVLGGNEEKDLFYRMRALGMSIWFLADAVVYHQIDDRRLTLDYVRRQAIGVGLSERVRLRQKGGVAILGKVWEEGVKTFATLVLSFGFVLRGSLAKAWMLLRFRVWVWRGLLGLGQA